MRRERQCHLVKLDFNLRMMIDFLGISCDAIDESETVQKSIKPIGAANGF